MTRRHDGEDRERGAVDDQLKKLAADDAFLDELSRGVDPTSGNDPLAGLLLGMRDEAHAPEPAVPDLSVLLPGFADAESQDESSPRTAEFAPVVKHDEPAEPAETTETDDLAERRERKKRRGVSPFIHGLVGAAAATLVIAGGGAAIFNSEPGSPLWGLNTALFGDHAAVVELASTLDELDSRTSEGDVDGARSLLDQARMIVGELNSRTTRGEAQRTETTLRQTETSVATVTETAPTPEPSTVTETSTATVTSHVPVPNPTPTGQPTTSLTPPQTITETPVPTNLPEPSLEPPQVVN